MADIVRDLFEISLRGFVFLGKLLLDVEASAALLLSLAAVWRVGAICALPRSRREFWEHGNMMLLCSIVDVVTLPVAVLGAPDQTAMHRAQRLLAAPRWWLRSS